MGAAAARSCGTCTLCCKLLSVETIGKPEGVWCDHCLTRRSCGIYDTRPGECRDYYCGFMLLPHLGEEWRPARSRLVLGIEPGGNTIYVYVDPARPDAWRREPFYSKLKEWARNAVPSHGRVIVRLGNRRIVVLPDRDVDLGTLGRDEMIVLKEEQLPRGVVLDAIKLKQHDPRAKQARTDGAPIAIS